jgi:hypothetical protein
MNIKSTMADEKVSLPNCFSSIIALADTLGVRPSDLWVPMQNPGESIAGGVVPFNIFSRARFGIRLHL